MLLVGGVKATAVWKTIALQFFSDAVTSRFASKSIVAFVCKTHARTRTRAHTHTHTHTRTHEFVKSSEFRSVYSREK